MKRTDKFSVEEFVEDLRILKSDLWVNLNSLTVSIGNIGLGVSEL